MMAHELARLLLARCDNEVMVRTEVDNDPAETGAEELHDVAWVDVTGVRYEPELDRVVIDTEDHYGYAYED